MRLTVVAESFGAFLLLALASTSSGREHRQTDLFSDVLSISNELENDNKGLQYYLSNYGPLAKVIVTDVMDTIGLARGMQLAIPAIAKFMVIVVYAATEFLPTLAAFKRTARSAYIFLMNFNTQDLRVLNEITDHVFEVLDKEFVYKKPWHERREA